MQVSRDYLLELDKKRTEMEAEIFQLTEFLNGEGMPGVDGKLVDREGFPIPNVDLMAVRTARNRLIILQNDLKNLMGQIEQSMQIFFKNANEEMKTSVKKEEINLKEPITVSVPAEEENKYGGSQNKLKIPFAWVESVSEGSPAEESGVKVGDGIISFDKSLYYGVTNDPLKRIAEIVGKKVNSEISVEIVRRNYKGEASEYITLTLIPHQWSGRGVLGCKLTLSEPDNK